MADDLRNRVLAAVRKGLAGPLDKPKTKKPRLLGHNVDSSTKNAVTNHAAHNRTFPSEISAVTALPPVSTNGDSQPEAVCAVCNAAGDLWHYGKVLVHQECARFIPKPKPAEPSAVYESVSAGPEGGCRVQVVEIPAAGLRYRRTFAHLQLRPPAHVPEDRWHQCIADARAFIRQWGEQAQALNWSNSDLFGLHTPPEQPHPSYSRLSRYDCTGLVWLLRGREVIALTEATASIRNPNTGNVTIYRKADRLR